MSISGEQKEAIEECIKNVLATFTKQYLLAYKTRLIEKIKNDFEKEPSDRELKSRPVDKSPLMSGYLTKRGAIRKNWKKRFFIVNYDYSVDYYEKEGGKIKGIMVLDGYKLNKNVAQSLSERALVLMKKLGVEGDAQDAEQKDKWPEHCFELHQEKRRDWYIHTETAEEKEQWIEMFKTCCRKAKGRSQDDKVAFKAFDDAIVKSRRELGRYGWWSYGGTEADILSDLIVAELESTIMSQIFGGFTGGYRARQFARSAVEKTIAALVTPAVAVAWKAVTASIQLVRPKVEDGLKKLMTPFLEAQKSLKEKLHSAVMSIVQPILEEVVGPALSPIIAVLIDPIHDAYKHTLKMYEERVDEFSNNTKSALSSKNVNKEMKSMYRHCQSWWSMKKAYKEVEEMSEPLYMLGELVSDISPWSIIYGIEDRLRKILEDAFYTLENTLVTDLKEDESKGEDETKARALIDSKAKDTLEKFRHDRKIAVGEDFGAILKQCVWPKFQSKVLPAIQDPLSPIASAVPDAMKDFIDVEALVEEFLEKLVDSSIEAVVAPTLEKLYENK